MQEWWIIWLPGMADKTKTTNTRYDRPSQSLAHGRKHFGQWASVFELLPPMATLMSRCKPCKILQTMESSQYVAGQTQQKIEIRLRTFCKHWDLRTKDFGNLAPWQPKVRFVALRWVEYEKRAAWAWMFRQEHLVWRKIMLTSSLEPQNVLNDVSPDFEATMNSQQPTHHVLEIALQASCSTPSFQQCQVSCSIRQPANGNQENRLIKKTS